MSGGTWSGGSWRWLAAVAVLAALAGCGGGEPKADRAIPLGDGTAATTTTAAPTTTTFPPTTTTVFAFGQDQALVSEVWGAYEDAIDAIERGGFDASPDEPGLAHLTGAMHRHWRERLTEFQTNGTYAYFGPDSTHWERLLGVAVRSPTEVVLTVCTYDDAIVAVRATGEVLDDDKSLLRAEERMLLVDGRWRFAERRGRYVEEAQCPELPF